MLNNLERRIKVCFVSPLGYPLYNKKSKRGFFGGGAAVQLYLITKTLAKNQYFEIDVITSNFNLTKNKIEIIKNIKLYNTRPLKRKLSYYFLSLFDIFITLIKIKPDVIIQRGANKITGICAFYSRYFKRKFIFSIANLPDINGDRERGFFGKMYKYGLDNATFIVAQHKNQVLELEKYKKRRFNNIAVIKSGYKIPQPIKEDRNHILWVGRAIDWKRPELYIKLAQKFSSIHFIMICNKSDEKARNIRYWDKINDKASKVSNLRFIEYVSFHEIDNFFKKALIFINTSIYEGFPNTYIQAFLNKTPVISLNVNPDEIFTNNLIGYWCNNNFDEMVNNLKELLENKRVYESISENCYEFVKKEHNIEKIAYSWDKIIRNTI